VILLNPLMGRLSADLDTHKDAEVLRALEPLCAVADRTSSAVMAESTSPAAPSGARCCGIKMLSEPENNLGKEADELPPLTYRIEGAQVAAEACGRRCGVVAAASLQLCHVVVRVAAMQIRERPGCHYVERCASGPFASPASGEPQLGPKLWNVPMCSEG